MSLDRLSLDQITEADLTALIGLPEGIALEFKREAYDPDPNKGEFRKDVCAFANLHGGHIVIGMAEAKGCASALMPLTGDSGKVIEALESLIRDGIEPRITGIRMRAVPVDGGHVIVVRVPRSWNPPHRVSVKGVNRFYLRNSNGAHEASVEELRMLFTLSATVMDRIRAFRQDRLAKIAAVETPVPLESGRGRIILHIAPFSAFSLHDPVNLKKASETKAELAPIGVTGQKDRFTFDGFMIDADWNGVSGCTLLFRNGCIEAVSAPLLAVGNTTLGPGLPAWRFLKLVMPAIFRYLDALQALDVPPPLVVMLTLEGCKDAELRYSEDQLLTVTRHIRESTLPLPEILIDDYGSPAEYHRALRPALDALWNAGGAAACTFYDAQGTYTAPP